MAKKKYDYFGKFTEMALITQASAKYLHRILKKFDPDKLPKHMEEIHRMENEADELNHKIHKNLSKDFLPPIEIEDVAALCNTLDDVMDYMEDVIRTIYAYNITEIRPDAIVFAGLIEQCTNALVKIVSELKNYKKSSKLKEHIIEINQFENEGDRLYLEALRKLYTEEKKDPIIILKWTKAYDYFERCCDAMEDASDIIENVILKNN